VQLGLFESHTAVYSFASAITLPYACADVSIPGSLSLQLATSFPKLASFERRKAQLKPTAKRHQRSTAKRHPRGHLELLEVRKLSMALFL
jgi:hypothetical protein